MESGSSGHGAQSYEQTLLAISIVPMLSDRPWSRCVDIFQATNGLACLCHWFMGEKQLRHSVVYVEVSIAPL